MDTALSVLPHCVWAVAAVVCVYRYVGRRSDVKRLEAIERGLDSHQSDLGLSKLAQEALAASHAKLQHRLEKLETPPARKVVF